MLGSGCCITTRTGTSKLHPKVISKRLTKSRNHIREEQLGGKGERNGEEGRRGKDPTVCFTCCLASYLMAAAAGAADFWVTCHQPA